MKLNELLNAWALNQNDVSANLNLAEEYTILDQPSAAISHYIKAYELSDDSNMAGYEIRYHCLCMICWLYLRLGHRCRGARQYAWFAKALMPDRPEAYALECKSYIDELLNHNQYEQCEWSAVYAAARSCLFFNQVHPASKSVYFEDIEFIKVWYATSLLRLNKHEELKKYLSSTEFFQINNPYIINSVIYLYGEVNLWCPYTGYSALNNLESLKLSFEGDDLIKYNHARNMQDIFALTVKKSGKGIYLDLGCGDPVKNNNTYTLNELGWTGISIDSRVDVVNKFNQTRPDKAYCIDAISLNSEWIKSLCKSSTIDYLSIDLGNPTESIKVLKLIKDGDIRYNCISFNHGGNSDVAVKSRDILTKSGYVLLMPDVKLNAQQSAEDWWIHVSMASTRPELLKLSNQSNGTVWSIFYNE